MHIRVALVQLTVGLFLGAASDVHGQHDVLKLRVLQGHKGSIMCLSFAPDGKTLASSSRDDMVRFWDVSTGKFIRELVHHTDDVYGVCYSPDGRLLATASADKLVCLWDADSLELLKSYDKHEDIVRWVTFSPDGKTLASCGADLTVRLWDVETGKQKHVMRGHKARTQCVAFSANGKLLASCGDGVRLWDPKNGTAIGELENPLGHFESFAFAPDGNKIAGSSSAGPIAVWDVGQQKLLKILDKDNKLEADSITFSPDGKWLAGGSKDKNIRIYNTKDLQLVRVISGNPGRIESLEFSPDSKLLVHGGGGGDTSVYFWNVERFPKLSRVERVRETFGSDPGWKGFHNRIVPSNPPTVTQDFGWSPPSQAGGSEGKIGGRIHRSRKMAYYAMPLGQPFSFDDHLSAEGTVTLMPREQQGGAYIGFFNHQHQEWRPWNAIVWRIGDYPQHGEVHLDYMAANWMANGLRLPDLLPGDGEPHRWRLEYDPDATPDLNWKSQHLAQVLPDRPTPESIILELVKSTDSNINAKMLRALLEASQDQGLVGSKNMGKEFYWWKQADPESLRGKVTFQLDKGRVHALFLLEEHRASPASFDRFGIFNFQLYGRHWEFYDNESSGVESECFLGNLVVNGEQIELTHDPKWEGLGNHMTFVDNDFHGRHDFGYSQTHWAGGEEVGEIGGCIWRNEVIDPLHSFYADPVGILTLDDPIFFSGKLAFVNGATDGDAYIGYFNQRQRTQEFSGGNRVYDPDIAQQLGERSKVHLGFDQRGSLLPGYFGFTIGGSTVEGYRLSLACVPTVAAAARVRGPLIRPDGALHTISFDYDPQAGNAGRVVAKLDEEVFTMDLTPQQRDAGATFDFLGITSPRQGGKWVTLYLDDLDYTVAQNRNNSKVRQKITKVPYPAGARSF